MNLLVGELISLMQKKSHTDLVTYEVSSDRKYMGVTCFPFPCPNTESPLVHMTNWSSKSNTVSLLTINRTGPRCHRNILWMQRSVAFYHIEHNCNYYKTPLIILLLNDIKTNCFRCGVGGGVEGQFIYSVRM